MLSSLFERFCSRKESQQSRKRRSSSLQGSLPTILFTTTCTDIKPLLPLTITDPISVPLSYHDHSITYGSSLDSLSTSKTSSVSSSSSLLSFLTDDGQPPTFTDSTSLGSISPSLVLSCAEGNNHEDKYDHSLSTLRSISSVNPIEVEPITTTKSHLVEAFRHSLASLITPSIITPTPPAADPIINPMAIDKCDSSIDTTLYDDNDHTIVTHPIHPHHYHHNPHYHHYQHYYIRSFRENPDHLRMIVAEVNMMRVNKLISPLRPRAILLERIDPFIPCTPSPLRHSI